MKVRILLVHNRLSFKPLTWFSFIIRIFTSSRWNHNALEITTPEGIFILESIGKGVIWTPYKKWLVKATRIVLPMELENKEVDIMPILGKIGMPYGKMDIVRIIIYLIRNRWLGHNYAWEPISYEQKGYICSEVVSELLGLDPKELRVPGDFEHLPLLKKGIEFKTVKQ